MIHSSLTGYLFEIESYPSCKCAQNLKFNIQQMKNFYCFFKKKEKQVLDLSVIDVVSTYCIICIVALTIAT